MVASWSVRSERYRERVQRLARRTPSWVGFLALLLLLSGFDATPALRDATTLEAVLDARLGRPLTYALLAPFCGLYDALSVLTARQHIWVLATYILLYILWRTLRTRPVPVNRWRRVGTESLAAAGALAALVTIYAIGVIAPRPMAALLMDDDDLLVVDFHTHTDASWDSRKPFDVGQRGRWHEAAGFHATFVSDHATWDGWQGTRRTRPGATRLLPAAEARYHHQHVVLLGDPVIHAPLLVDGNVDSLALATLRGKGVADPLAILTLPARLDQLPNGADGTLAIGAIEISDASPKGLEFAHVHRQTLVALADSLGIALVAGTNHHGWGRTAAAWNVMHLPGWREMSDEQLAATIADRLRTEGRAAVRVIERNPPVPANNRALAATMPTTAWRLFATLSWSERLAWLGWAGLFVGLGAGRRTLARQR